MINTVVDLSDVLTGPKRKLAILVPAHNEQEVIAATIHSLIEVVSAEDIFVVNDGSTDQTESVAKQFLVNVLTLQPNVGKATAMNKAIQHFEIIRNYQYILPMDADTKITSDFLKHTLPILEKDQKQQIVCVVGKVIGKSNSWITTYRIWEYEVAQTIHKAAQSAENAVIVCPGCATVYRTNVFKNAQIPTGTLTEDMDFTFLIHRQNLGKIVYTEKALVVTQDPLTLKDFLKQIDRWYTGFWQCVTKHNIPWGGQVIDFEVFMLASEGLFNGLLISSFLFIIPLTLLKHPNLLLVPFVADLLLFLIPTMLMTAIRHRYWKIFLFIPNFYLVRFLSCLIFIKSFIKVVLGFDFSMGWNKATRYWVEG